jgi:hypothetical protein
VDDRQAQFLISAQTLCSEAHLASLEVELLLARGLHVVGVPVAADDPDLLATVVVDDTIVPLAELVEIRLHRP